jgi:hypothetical protein
MKKMKRAQRKGRKGTQRYAKEPERMHEKAKRQNNRARFIAISSFLAFW